MESLLNFCPFFLRLVFDWNNTTVTVGVLHSSWGQVLQT